MKHIAIVFASALHAASGLSILSSRSLVAKTIANRVSEPAYCTFKLKGVDSMRQILAARSVGDPTAFENATLDFYNPAISPIQTKDQGRKVFGSLRLSATGGQDCNANQIPMTLGQIDTNLSQAAFANGTQTMNQRSNRSRTLKWECMRENWAREGFRRYRDFTVSGWLDPESCEFDVEPLSLQDGWDAKEYAFASPGVATVLRQARQLKKHVPISKDTKVEAMLTYIFAGKSTGVPLLFSGSSGPCWRGCTELIPNLALEYLCGGGGGASLVQASDSQGRMSSDLKPTHFKMDVKEKNMSPFEYNGRTHFIYTLNPLQICTVSPEEIADREACLMCHNQAVTKLDAWDPLAMNSQLAFGLADLGLKKTAGIPSKDYHLNGVQLLSLPANSGLQGFLGVAHAIAQSTEAGSKIRRYRHFLFLLSPDVPFSITNVSAVLPLGAELSSALYWIPEPSGLSRVEVTFVSGMSLVPASSQNGAMDLMITYGAGDDESRLIKMPWPTVLRLFGDNNA
jgi:hypothetical protein